MKKSAIAVTLFYLVFGIIRVGQSQDRVYVLPKNATLEQITLRIIQLEDERNAVGGELAGFLTHKQSEVRERAALAIGRIGEKNLTSNLAKLLEQDATERVRSMAAFALGEMEDDKGVPVLMAALDRRQEPLTVQARSVEALGKIVSAQANASAFGPKLTEAINDLILKRLPEPTVKLSAEQKLLATLSVTALMRIRSAASVEPLTRQLKSDDVDIRAQAANALARIRQPIAAAVPALLEALNDSDYNVRANAARALGVSKDARAVEALIKLLGDKNEQVQVSAIRALAAIGDKQAIEPLIAMINLNLSQGLVLEIAAAFGTFKDERALKPLNELRKRLSPLAAPEIELAIAKFSEATSSDLRERLNDLTRNACRDWKQATVAAQTISALLPTEQRNYWEIAFYQLNFGLLSKVDKLGCDQRSLPEILRAYSKLMFSPAHASFLQSTFTNKDVASSGFDSTKFLAFLHEKLASNDLRIRATAASILGEQKKEESLALLVAALKKSTTDEDNEAKFAILTALSKYKSAQAIEAIKTALNDSDHLVRRRAVDLLKQAGAGDFSDRIGIVKTGHDKLFYQRVVARMNKKVTATLHTDKGAVTMELFPSEAPITVDSFITLAHKGYFNGITFHRVVPNFVIQGGDPQGTGEGGPGYQIRCEVNTKVYGRGALGMALSGKDTGGSQFFITHSPQPHLDGGYTVFGQVTKGMDVVDRIARGDRIQKIVIVER